jgi:ribosome-associated protein
MSQNRSDQSLRSQRSQLDAPIDAHRTIENLSDLDDRIQRVLHAAEEKKASNSTVLDLREVATFTDFFVITTGANKRQMQAISDEVVEQLKRHGSRAARVEGYQTAEWILIDYGDFIVHIFDEKSRRFYDLERLWRQAKRLDVSLNNIGQLSNFVSTTSGSLKEE